MDLKNRIGRFRLPREGILNHPEAIMKIMGEVIVVDVDCYLDEFEYTAHSEQFEKIEPNEPPKHYGVKVTEDGEVVFYQ